MLPVDDTGTVLFMGDWDDDPVDVAMRVTKWSRVGEPLRLARVHNGLGAWDSFSYSYGGLSGERAQLPAATMTASKSVVLSHSHRTGPDGYRHDMYTYKNPRMDLYGRGFLGFGETIRASLFPTATDPPSAKIGGTLRTVRDFTYDEALGDYAHASKPSVVEHSVILDNDDGTTRREITCEMIDPADWSVVEPDPGNTWFSYPTETRVVTHPNAGEAGCESIADGSSWTLTERVHQETRNVYGSTTWSEDVVSGTGVLLTTTTTASDFTQDEAEWHLGRPRHVETTSCGSGSGASLAECETRTQEFVYDEAHAEVDEEVTEPGDALLELTTRFERNDAPGANGRTINRTRTDFAGRQRVERFGWDSNGVHLEWSSNPKGQISYFVNDGPTGALVATVQPSGTSAETKYDGFLRPVDLHKRKSPMGAEGLSWQTTEYEAPGPSDSFAQRLTTRVMPAGQVRVLESGPTGKTLREQWEGVVPLAQAEFQLSPGPSVFNQVEVFHEYDARGRLVRESRPT